MKNIVVIGSLNMDLVTRTDRMPEMGETLSGISFQTVCGGKGANQSCAIAKLGGNIKILGCIGDDSFGVTEVESLTKDGVDCSQVETKENMSTGIATINVCQGNNCIIIIHGANYEVDEKYIDAHLDTILNADFISMQLEIPIKTVLYVLDIAKKNNIPVMLNPSPAVQLPKEAFDGLDHLIVNETECEFYSGTEVNSPDDAIKGIEAFKKLGVKNVIITLGGAGSVYNVGDEVIHTPARKVEAVDSTAAGDTFTGATIVGLTEGMSKKEAIEFATVASSIVVTRMGAQTSIPTRKEVEELK